MPRQYGARLGRDGLRALDPRAHGPLVAEGAGRRREAASSARSVIAEAHGLGPELCSRWLRTLSVVCDDLGEAQKRHRGGGEGQDVGAPLRGQMHPETVAAAAGLVHTMRLALHPVVPELRELAAIWPTMSEAERKVQIEVVKRFIQRRNDLSPAEVEMLDKITAEPQGVQAVLPPPEPKADTTELAKVMAELDALVGLREVKAEFKRLASVLQVEEMRRAAKLDGRARAPTTSSFSARPAPARRRSRGCSGGSSSRSACSRKGRWSRSIAAASSPATSARPRSR